MGQRYSPLQKKLIEAVKADDPIQLEEVLFNGLEVDVELKYGSTALLIAAAKGNLNAARYLLDHGAKVNRRNLFGSSALLEAVAKGHCEVVKLLVERGAEINLQHKNGSTPLLIATFRRDLKMVRTLVSLGASVLIADDDGWDPVKWTLSEGNTALLEILSEAKGFKGMFERYSSLKEIEHVARGEETMESINNTAGNNIRKEPALDAFWSAFMRAATKGDTRTVKELVEFGVEPNTASPNGTTALIAAAKNGHSGTLTELVELGVDLDHRDHDGMTALMWAAIRGDKQMVLTLIQKGASPTGAIELAQEKGQGDIAELITSTAAGIN